MNDSSQLSLIEQLSPSLASTTGTPGRTRRRPLSAVSANHGAALECLLQGPAPLFKIARAAGEPNEEKVIQDLRALGLDLPTVVIPLPTTDALASVVTVCRLSDRDARTVQKYIRTLQTDIVCSLPAETGRA